MTRLALLVNMIAPYRVPVYQRLGEAFDLMIFHGGQEGNRSAWKSPESELSNVQVKQSWGVKFSFYKKDAQGKVFDRKFIHITPGYLWDLIRSSPDVVISNEMGFRSAIALFYALLFRKPIWIWSGVTCQSEQAVGRGKRMIRLLFAKSSCRWISYGHAATEYLQTLGVSLARIVQIQNCVDERLYQKHTESSLQLSPKPVLLYVGQLIRRKGVAQLLEAVRKLQQQGHRFSVLLVGSGESDEFQNYVAQHQLENVHFLGSHSPEELLGIYRSANFLIFPTLEDIWGLVVNEALWSGLPVLASTYAGCAREILPPDNLFDPHCSDSIVQALTKALTGQIAPADVSVLWTHDQVAQKIIDDIHQTVSRPAIFSPLSDTVKS
ncbi:glycosyltransferase family 4 protein [Leptolyngbya boryana CZ1]|uniref:Glycosyltransferase family 4 protein n=1 Tax=Leptolyngbya boryana CZ1 TaxID=3060204 RepID=A0AA96X8Q5_LEPBY|nr:glycosyltransferase family 4 protein [Leptolyngbya boryana]WNZ47630.1 glycosyltransferase family 4 protein [Leptolyngbya boryana CZ1]